MNIQEAIEAIYRLIDDNGLYGMDKLTDHTINALYEAIRALERVKVEDEADSI